MKRSQLIIILGDRAVRVHASEQTDVILFGFKKVFAEVPHQRLLLKTDHQAIR